MYWMFSNMGMAQWGLWCHPLSQHLFKEVLHNQRRSGQLNK